MQTSALCLSGDFRFCLSSSSICWCGHRQNLIPRCCLFCPCMRMLWSAGDLMLSLLQMSSFVSFSRDYSCDACDLWLRQEWDERVPCLNYCIEVWLHWSGGKQLHPGPSRTNQSTDLVWSQSLPTLRPAAMSQDELQSSSFAMKEAEVWRVRVQVIGM